MAPPDDLLDPDEPATEAQMRSRLRQLHQQLQGLREQVKEGMDRDRQTADREQAPDESVGGDNKIIICAVRRPIKLRQRGVGEGWQYVTSRGAFKRAIDTLKRRNRVHWVSWPGESVAESSQDAVRQSLMRRFNVVPVFLPKQLAELYFQQFCCQILWPLFHGLAIRSSAKTSFFKSSQFEAYRQANHRFMEAVATCYTPGDIVIVYDYHLLLLPSMLRRRFPQITLGFFLHCPFPSSEIYRQLPMREVLLDGLLGADVLTFHDFDYARQFEKVCKSILGLRCSPKFVKYQSRRVALQICPMGIVPHHFRRTPEVAAEVARLNDEFAGLKLIIGVDRLDLCKGIAHKILAFERFLEMFPEWVGRVVFVLIVCDSSHDVGSTGVQQNPGMRQLSLKINEMVGRVTGRFGTSVYCPIRYLRHSIGHTQMVSLYTKAEVMMVTSTREGFNLCALEYVACQESTLAAIDEAQGRAAEARAAKASVPSAQAATSSETALAAAGVAAGAPAVGQANGTMTGVGIGLPAGLGLGLGEEEEEDEAVAGEGIAGRDGKTLKEPGVLMYSEFAGCAKSLRGAVVVNPYNTDEVARQLHACIQMNRGARRTRAHMLLRYAKRYTGQLWALRVVSALKEAAAEQTSLTRAPLHLMYNSAVVPAFRRSRCRLLLLAYEGTLAPFESLPQLAGPSPRLKTVLAKLCADRSTRVCITSDYPRRYLQHWFQGLSVGLVAESGFAFHFPAHWFDDDDDDDDDDEKEGENEIVEDEDGESISILAHPRLEGEAIVQGKSRQGRVERNVEAAPSSGTPSASCAVEARVQEGASTAGADNSEHLANEEASATDDVLNDTGNVGCAASDVGEIGKTSQTVVAARTSMSGTGSGEVEEREKGIGRERKDDDERSERERRQQELAMLQPWVQRLVRPPSPPAPRAPSRKTPSAGRGSHHGEVQTGDKMPVERRGRKQGTRKQAELQWLWQLTLEPKRQVKWLRQVLPPMRHYADQTPGVLVEVREASIAWHFRDADHDFGLQQARDLMRVLGEHFVQQQRVDVFMSPKLRYLYVLPASLTLGRMARQVIEAAKFSKSSHLDFDMILSAGHENLDEDLLKACAAEYHCFNCVVGRRENTHAATHYLDSHEQLVRVLESFSEHHHHRRDGAHHYR